MLVIQNRFKRVIPTTLKGGGADVPLFETIKTNAGTQPKNELQL